MNMSKYKVPMPSESPETRKRNFNEVAKGYSAQEAVEEANRCLNCKNKPCVQGCPVNVQIPDFISLIAKEDFEGAAAKIILIDSFFPSSVLIAFTISSAASLPISVRVG